MAYGIKAKGVDPRARTFAFSAYKRMYGDKLIAIALRACAISALSSGSAAAAENQSTGVAVAADCYGRSRCRI